MIMILSLFQAEMQLLLLIILIAVTLVGKSNYYIPGLRLQYYKNWADGGKSWEDIVRCALFLSAISQVAHYMPPKTKFHNPFEVIRSYRSDWNTEFDICMPRIFEDLE